MPRGSKESPARFPARAQFTIMTKVYAAGLTDGQRELCAALHNIAARSEISANDGRARELRRYSQPPGGDFLSLSS
jgi:hypothetical protein